MKGSSRPLFVETVDRLAWPTQARRTALRKALATAGKLSALSVPELALIEARLPSSPITLPACELRLIAQALPGAADLDGLRAVFAEAHADLALFADADVGCARSGNRHLVADLAFSLAAGYVFAAEWLNLGAARLCDGRPSSANSDLAGLSGLAILSRRVLSQLSLLRLRELAAQRLGPDLRLGSPIALFAQAELAGQLLTLVWTRLPPANGSPAQLPLLARLLATVADYAGHGPVLVGAALEGPFLAESDSLRQLTAAHGLTNHARKHPEPSPHSLAARQLSCNLWIEFWSRGLVLEELTPKPLAASAPMDTSFLMRSVRVKARGTG